MAGDALIIDRAVANSQAALAASCGSGTLIQSYPLYSKVYPSTKIAELDIYYSTANGGTNTGCLVHVGAAWGVALDTGVFIWKCASYYNCNGVDPFGGGWNAGDAGTYAYYTGPVSVTGTASRCVALRGHVLDPYNRLSYSEIVATGVGCAATPTVSRF